MMNGMGGQPQDGDFLKNLFNQLQDDSVIRAQMNDQRLMKLAEYAVTQGYMKSKATQDDFQSKFLELKGLVQRGSFTIKALEDDVYNKFGIQEESREQDGHHWV
jgi:hypothetical protein